MNTEIFIILISWTARMVQHPNGAAAAKSCGRTGRVWSPATVDLEEHARNAQYTTFNHDSTRNVAMRSEKSQTKGELPIKFDRTFVHCVSTLDCSREKPRHNSY